MEQVGGWGEVMNATAPRKGGGEDIAGLAPLRDPRLGRPSCGPEENGGDNRNKSIITRLSGEALRGHGGESVWKRGRSPSKTRVNAAPGMRYRLLVGNEVTAAVLLPARFGRLHAERLFLAPTGGCEALNGNAEAD